MGSAFAHGADRDERRAQERFRFRQSAHRFAVDGTHRRCNRRGLRRQGSRPLPRGRRELRDRRDPRNRLGETAGRTAGELGITEVAHATRDFETWESIRKSPLGVPLFFISRQGAEGEAAIHGDGLYTEVGKEGWSARGGFSIRMKVEPHAREGVDFKHVRVIDYQNGGFRDWLVWYTRDKLRVIPESLDIPPEEALAFIVDPQNAKELGKKELLKK